MFFFIKKATTLPVRSLLVFKNNFVPYGFSIFIGCGPIAFEVFISVNLRFQYPSKSA